MELKLKLLSILRRVELSAKELDLQPECFQATIQLKIVCGDLAEAIAGLDGELEDLHDLAARSATNHDPPRPRRRISCLASSSHTNRRASSGLNVTAYA